MSAKRLLEGKRVLITGGSRGLGSELCAVFAKHGARVAFTWSRDEAGAKAVREAIAAEGGDVHDYRCSVTDNDATERTVRQIEKELGPLDVLVNNAGTTQNLPLALLEEEDFDKVMDTNVKGTYLTSRSVLRGMIRRKAGVVLNLGSLAGERLLEAPMHYCASKAAIRGMTQALAKEVSRYNVRVLCLAPGLLEDGMGRNLPEHRLGDYLHHCALGRVGKLREVAEFAAFLVSDRNTYMNGETVVMDGGV